MSTRAEENGGYRSLFWPMILIGVGVVWLLANLGVLTAESIAAAFRLWPLLLIVAGLDLLFGRQSPVLGALIGLGTVVVFIVLMLIGPSLGLVPTAETESIVFESEAATAYTVNLNASVAPIEIRALESANTMLVEGVVNYYGDLETGSTGGETPVITIDETSEGTSFSLPPNWFGAPSALDWNLRLNADLPLTLDINGGVGELDVNLVGFDLVRANFNTGVGSLNLALPLTETGYTVTISGGVGEAVVDLPDDAPVRLEASTGVGSIDVAGWLPRISGGDDFVSDSGVWESASYAGAENQIQLRIEGGVGSIQVR